MNIGEIDERLVKLRLIELSIKKPHLIINGQQLNINTVGWKRQVYSNLPCNADLETIKKAADKGNYIPLENLCLQVGICKAPARSKSDVYINGKGFSIKSHRAAPPAIVNHTPRNGWLRVAKELGYTDITVLDGIIDDYWELRTSGIIQEDIQNNDPDSPFNSHFKYLKPFLEYFLFKGTGSYDSSDPADELLEVILWMKPRGPFQQITILIMFGIN